MKLEKYYEDPQTLHVGTEENRAYFIPYEKFENDRTMMLSDSNWYFKWFANSLLVNENFTKGIIKDFDVISVPSCVNILGYDKNQYCNVKGPIPFDPPYVPLDNPCGAYVKEFEINDLDSLYYLNFEGVDSCFYLWVNGNFAGYSQVSHSTSEFNITKHLNKGKNFISVLVLKWCDGTYFEDQDKLRMTGIFRDVYILKRPKKHLKDFTVNTVIDKISKIQISLDFNEAIEYQVMLEGPDKKIIDTKAAKNNYVEFNIENPLLWNAETPNIYTIIIKYEKEIIKQSIGLRKVEIKNSILYVNGQNIKIKGTNRHDFNAYTGYVISKEQLYEDLMLMKQHNINAIRTSHYPNSPWAYEMYLKLGFYILNEADMETHNTELIYAGGRSNYNYEDETIVSTSFGMLCSNPEYEKTILDRIKRLIIRDKNQSCVIMWSLGNESGYGINMEKAAAWIKNFNKDFLIHYESSIYKMPDHENDLSNIDVYSRMYMPVRESEMYCKKNPKKPLVLCEFICAMGNGPGDIEDYFEKIYAYDVFSGGFIWEWCDHGIYAGKTIDGKDKFLYGGDFGEFPNEGNFCVDGMLGPDRKPHTGLLEYKNVARPIRASYEENRLSFKNTMDFINVKDLFNIKWKIVVNGNVINQGIIINLDIKPHEKVCIKENLLKEASIYISKENDVYTMFEYVTNKEYSILPINYKLGFDQIILSKKEWSIV